MALSDEEVAQLRQLRFNAICGKISHRNLINGTRAWCIAVDYTGVAVPVILGVMTLVVLRLGVRELLFVVIADIAGGALFLLAGLKTWFKWQDRLESHVRQMEVNSQIASDAEIMLRDTKSISPSTLSEFMRRAQMVETEDDRAFGQIKDHIRQPWYRLALREVNENCPNCGALPWNYTPGSCGVCGGTPVKKGES